eukprot:252120-Amphidinium_carterae.3
MALPPQLGHYHVPSLQTMSRRPAFMQTQFYQPRRFTKQEEVGEPRSQCSDCRWMSTGCPSASAARTCATASAICGASSRTGCGSRPAHMVGEHLLGAQSLSQ